MSIKSKLQVWLPRSARPTHFCTVPIGDGRVCGEAFYAGQDRQRIAHAAKCAAEHRDEMAAAYAEARPAAFFTPFDPEYAAWTRDHGRAG